MILQVDPTTLNAYRTPLRFQGMLDGILTESVKETLNGTPD